MRVYIVQDWRDYEGTVDSVWSTNEAAGARAFELRTERGECVGSVEEFVVDAGPKPPVALPPPPAA